MDKRFLIAERLAMVDSQIRSRGVRDENVLKAMKEIPRHYFVPENLQMLAYEDSALGIGYKQTISQPYIVALMTEAAHLCSKDKVLEIGTGSGYQAAVLSYICQKVFTIELIVPLLEKAKESFRQLHCSNIYTKAGNGYDGWSEEAPFDAILITAAPPQIPEKLLSQLKFGGRMILPCGSSGQQILLKLVKTPEGYRKQELLPVRFVPMVE